MSKDDHDLLMEVMQNQFYINKLITKISDYNNQSEYFRLKYYCNMIHEIKILIGVMR